MGIRRYLERKNWYSDDVILLLKREAGACNLTLRKGHEVHRVTAENISDSQYFESPKYLKIYSGFLEHGDIGIFGYAQGKCVARCWGVICPTDVTEGGLNLELEDNSVFVHYVKTAVTYRREKLGKEVLGALIDSCKEKQMYVTIHIDNVPSLKLHKQYGFKECGIIRIKRRLMCTRTKIYRFDVAT